MMVSNIATRRSAARAGRGSGDERLLRRQNPHSLFLVCAAIILVGTVIVDLVLHRETINPLISVLLILGIGVLGSAALIFGKRVPIWVGMAATGLFAAATLFFLSPLSDAQSAVSSLQELPVLALYLAWFVRPPVNRVIMLAVIVLFSAVLMLNPVFWADGSLGPSPAVQGILVAFCCFEVGLMLWRRSQRKVDIDQLTGALTRSAFLERLESELLRAQRRAAPLCLVVIDFDSFKELNDTHGHAAGDTALAGTVQQWRRHLRAGDVLGRTGGDEFALLLRGADALGAQQSVRRLREHSMHPWSWGVAQARADDDAESLFGRADTILYTFKRGRQ